MFTSQQPDQPTPSQPTSSSDALESLGDSLRNTAAAESARGAAENPSCDRLKYVTDLNRFLLNPDYRVVFFARHAHAVQENKKVEGKDKYRELDDQGKEDAAALGRTLSDLQFDKVVMVTSSATRTHETAKAIEREIKAHDIDIVADDRFYHVPVKEYFKYLRETDSLQDTRHAFIVGHNAAMTKVFLKISGHEKAFIPTAGVLALAVKASSWENYYKNEHDEVHVFTWSPRGTEVLESSLECARMDVPSEYSMAQYTSASLEFLA